MPGEQYDFDPYPDPNRKSGPARPFAFPSRLQLLALEKAWEPGQLFALLPTFSGAGFDLATHTY